MRLKTILAFVLFFSGILITCAQSKDILAKSAMLNADEAYSKGDYSKCLKHLKDAEINLGKSNSRIQYLKVKSLMALGTDDFNNKTLWLQADTALKVFFEVTPENGYVPEKYEEMLFAVSNVKTKIAEIETAEQLFKQLKFGSVTDSRDGKTYKTIDIGTQTWLAENLAYKAKTGCWAYDNNPDNVATYGYLYNWETAKKVCPAGLHLPTRGDEWTTLINYLGGKSVAGGKMKEQGNTHWKEQWAKAATNESGFTALPGGSKRDEDGLFERIGEAGFWWSATEISPTYAGQITLGAYNNIQLTSDSKNSGFSVRCVKDISELKKWNAIIEREPTNAGAYAMRGHSKSVLRDYEGAIMDYTKALEINPDFCYAYVSRGKALQFHIKDIQAAKDDYEKVILICGNDPAAAYSCYYLGDKEKAFNILKKILKDAGDNKEKQKSIYYDLACLYSVDGNQAEALKSLKNAFEKGYNDFYWIENDEDFDNIRNSPEFKELINKYKNK